MFRAPQASSEIEESIKKSKDKIIVLYEMLQNHCLEEGIPLICNIFLNPPNIVFFWVEIIR